MAGSRRHHRAVALAFGALAPALGIAQIAPTSLPSPADGTWHYTASIYAYLPSVDTKTSFPADSGGTPIEFNSSILETLKLFAMGTFGAHNGTWGVFTDIVYLKFGNTRSNSRDFTIGNVGLPAGTSADLGWDLKGLSWTVAGEYRVASDPSWTVDLIGGIRALDLREHTDWNISGSIGSLDPAARTGSKDVSQGTVDAIIGVKGRFGFGTLREWSVPFYLDAGGGGSNSTSQAAVGLGYRFGWGELTGMWRYLAWNSKSGKPIEDLSFSGPLVSATFRW